MNRLANVLGAVFTAVARHVFDDRAFNEPEAIGVNELDRLDFQIGVMTAADLTIAGAHSGAPRNHATPSMICTSSGGISRPPLNVSTANP